jgi:epsilon-lactone hydrolase
MPQLTFRLISLRSLFPQRYPKNSQEILKSLRSREPTFVAPGQDDANGWQKLNQHPWVDLTGKGDTFFTLKNADPLPLLTPRLLLAYAAAYANPSDQKNPYVSPVYGNFSSGFPPTLIQGGTKEILLSDFVRLYQALDQAGIPVKLDIYEGMPHVFQTYFFHNTTESDMAISKTNHFLRKYLGY